MNKETLVKQLLEQIDHIATKDLDEEKFRRFLDEVLERLANEMTKA